MRERPVAIIMGSDFDQMVGALRALDGFGIQYSLRVLSAHRSPEKVREFAVSAGDSGVKVIIAVAGMAAHLAGVIAAHTTIPVLGVPAKGGALNGFDALLSTAQMPGGVPVGTLGIGKAGGTNAAMLAARILGLSDERIAERLVLHRETLEKETEAKNERIGKKLSELGAAP